MPPEAGERLSGAMALGLATMYERTQPGPSGGWLVAGQHAVRSNTMRALAKRGLVEMRLNSFWPGSSWWEGRITAAGVAWVESASR